MITDTHCHLDSEVFREDLAIVIDNAKAVGVKRFVIPAADLKDLEYAKAIASKYEEVYFASGVHPYHLESYDFERVRAMCEEKKCIAVGECGLDYFRLSEGREQEEREEQKRVLIEQIELSIKLNLPLILHVREASHDIAEILRHYPKARGVFHCFNADEVLLEFKERFFYGIGGVLTFKNARRLLEVLPKIPLSRLVLETDAPYLTPHPHRGERNEPKFIPLVLQKISEILAIPVEQISEQCEKNTKELFDL
ncbi:TatD family hydrolase [Helicobacter brantae]|uniref:Hydrolase TatD n=1 Tax=Helicobacter brantae TaxID=375927 RepID=A0A3D8J5V7_9HELI|nr:TatD family hydrolase [Helicobacter brantae]RDU72181.1 hydrolase TatD [Helicobacter brantae]